MKIYIAGSYEDQVRLRAEGDRLWKLGHVITGTWLHETKPPAGMPARVFKKKLAIKDLCEISAADLLIYDVGDQHSTGKSIEFGYALGQYQHKQIWLVGEPHSCFQELADLEFNHWDDVIEYLSQEEEDTNYAVD